MNQSDETIKISKSQIREVYTTLKNLSDSYKNKSAAQSDSEWLADQYKTFFPSLSDKEAAQLGNATVSGVQRFDHTLQDAIASAATGKSKEQWFTEKMSQEISGMDASEAGEYIHSIDSALLSGNQHLIENAPVEVDENDVTLHMPDLAETDSSSESTSTGWNPFTVKDALIHVGQGAALVGLQTMNQTGSLQFAADAVGDMSESAQSLKDLIESGDTEQVKTLLTAALKIGADSNALPFISSAASVDTIANVASHGVEYISTLSKFSAGEITMMQALDHVGLSGVSLLYNLCSVNGIRTISTALLSQIPLIGPVLGNIVGGIISITLGKKFHEKVKETIKKVETKVRTVVNNAWNTIKSIGRTIKNKVKNFCNWLFS